MKLFLPPLEIGDDEGFDPEKDIFGRKAIGDGLTNLVTSINQPLVIALDAQWGSGKSTFLKMWAGELRKQEIGVVLFDAFENDYLEDAFTAIAGQIVSLAKDKDKAKEGRIQRFAQRAYDAGKIVARSGLKIGIKAATVGALEAEDFAGIAKDIGSEASSLGDKYLGEAITKQKEQKAIIEQFREALSELPGLLSPPSVASEGRTQKPLIIIIDELDRCRPSFALDVLERAKHFFAVPNVHFVLGVNLAQLENSVKSTYGVGIDAKTYLQKFISIPISLIDPITDADTHPVSRFCLYMFEQLEFGHGDASLYAAYITHVAKHRNLSLRTAEKIITSIVMAYAFTKDNAMRPPAIVAGLSILRIVEPQLFLKALTGGLSYNEVEQILALNINPEHVRGFNLSAFAYMWRYVLHGGLSDGDARPISRYFEDYGIYENKNILRIVSSHVMQRYVIMDNQ